MKRVLIVEDDRYLLNFVSRLFRQRGYRVDSASSCRGGFDLAHSDEYSLYLLDVNLPDGSGIDLCDYIRTMSGTSPIIVYSGDGSNESHAMRAGANAFIPKSSSLEGQLNQVLSYFENMSPSEQVA